MSAPQTLETARLQLRPYTKSDHAAFITLNTDPVVRQHMNGPMTEETATERVDALTSSTQEPPSIAWAIIEKSSATYIGHAFIAPAQSTNAHQLGFLLSESHWSKGLATETARRISSHAIDDLNLPRLIATVDADHIPSQRVLEKSGFTRTAEEHDDDGPYFVYSLEPS